MINLTKAFGYTHHYLCQNCSAYNVGFMSKKPIEMLEDISLIDLPGVVEGGFGGHGVIAARIDGIVYVNTHLTPFSNDPDTSNRRAGAKAIVDRIVKKYEEEPLLVMGDHNNVSPEDKNRYDVDFLCANGGVTYCDHPNSPTDNTTVEINYDSIQEYLDAGLSDLYVHRTVVRCTTNAATAAQLQSLPPTQITWQR